MGLLDFLKPKSSKGYFPAMAVPKEIVAECKYVGTDLVELVNSGPCCEKCAKYRRRIYSISGKDKRFPKFPADYEPHGCMSAYPYIDGVMEPSFDAKDIVRYSNRPFVDDRTEEEIKRYKEWERKK